MATFTQQFMGFDGSASYDDGTKTVTKKFLFTADSADATVADLLSSSVFPALYSVMSENSMYALTGYSKIEASGDAQNAFNVHCDYTYSTAGYDNDYYNADDVDENTAPWELGASFSKSTYTMQKAPDPKKEVFWYNEGATEEYTSRGNIGLQNSAGQINTDTEDVTVTRINISWAVECRSSSTYKDFNTEPIVNNTAITILNENVAYAKAKLQPVDWTLMVTRDNEGEVKWRYYSCTTSIDISPRDWFNGFLNVGNMALFDDGNDGKAPGNIYKFKKLGEAGVSDITEVGVVADYYGSFAELMVDKAIFDLNYTGEEDCYPWEQITEPIVPLKADGTIYYERLADPDNNPMLIYGAFDGTLGDFSKFNIPESIK